ncbi:MAG TPA: hypothetical protein VKY65_04145 [Alphaproteobacteria bacterium]|nr:hypothetical protein [Alphaproteobacteria bacterium]
MGIASYIAEAIIREHKFKPITGTVLLLGRQTMFFSPEKALALLRTHGIAVPDVRPEDIEIDRQTLQSGEGPFILDEAFFKLLGVPKIRALDYSAYEGADIIHDLNRPIPDQLEGFADFILDGSTLDNMFSPAAGLMNIARMLKPGGRLIGINMGSAHYAPYSVFTPYWFLDYFTVNAFADCQIIQIVHHPDGTLETRIADPAAEIGHAHPTEKVSGIFVFAEKGKNSTWDVMPEQRHYASERFKEIYRKAAEKESSRKNLPLIEPQPPSVPSAPETPPVPSAPVAEPPPVSPMVRLKSAISARLQGWRSSAASDSA